MPYFFSNLLLAKCIICILSSSAQFRWKWSRNIPIESGSHSPTPNKLAKDNKPSRATKTSPKSHKKSSAKPSCYPLSYIMSNPRQYTDAMSTDSNFFIGIVYYTGLLPIRIFQCQVARRVMKLCRKESQVRWADHITKIMIFHFCRMGGVDLSAFSRKLSGSLQSNTRAQSDSII